jgi:hypothetical protein
MRIINSLFVALIAMGCAFTEIGLERIRTNVGEVAVEASRRAYLVRAHVYSADGVTDIGGRVGSRTGFRLIESGHISVTIRDADGELLHEEEVRCTRRRYGGRRSQTATFRATAPVEVPPGEAGCG